MAKKKKTQQKPLARGFAVTSIPKKAPPLEQGDVKGEEPSIVKTPDAQDAQHHEPVEDEVLNCQKAEERSLQDIVDKLQEKTEKEIVRTVKVRGCA